MVNAQTDSRRGCTEAIHRLGDRPGASPGAKYDVDDCLVRSLLSFVWSNILACKWRYFGSIMPRKRYRRPCVSPEPCKGQLTRNVFDDAGALTLLKLEFHGADTDSDILARILADTSDTRDFLKLFLWQAERHADILATILARMLARMSVSVSAPWNASLSARMSWCRSVLYPNCP